MKKGVILFLFILFVIFVTVASTCKKDNLNCHRNISIVNNSNYSIYLKYAFGYPDTLLQDPKPYMETDYFKVDPREDGFTISNKDCFETVYEHYISSDTLMVFIFDSKIFENYTWDDVKKDYKILKRYDLSLDDLRKIDFKLTYPPTDLMKDIIKMYPPE